MFTGFTRSGLWSQGTYGSPKFPANPSGLCRALGPRRSLAPGLCGAQACPLQLLLQRHPSVMTFEALSHGFSRRCLRFVPSSRTTTQNSLPVADRPFRVGFSMPTEFVRRVSHLHALPSPRAFLGARQFSFCGVCGVWCPRFSVSGATQHAKAWTPNRRGMSE